MKKIIPKIEMLLIGAWLGAATFFSLAVAPSAFAVMGSRELAGAMVNRTLMFVNVSGMIIGVILILTSLVLRPDARAFWVWTQRVLLALMTIACAVGQFVIAFWLAYLRLQAKGPIDSLAADDPLRLQFNQLHQYSVWVLIAGIIAALLAFFVISRKSPVKAPADGGFELPDELKF